MRLIPRLTPAPALVLALCVLATSAARAELPLPDVTFYGQIKTKDGTPVTSGALKASVKRGAAKVLDAAGEFKSADGAVWYIVRIPMETNIGAPGPNGAGAHEGDLLDALLLQGTKLELGAVPPVFKAGTVTRIDATSSAPSLPPFIRGDCNADQLVDISDAIGILNFLFVSPNVPPCLDACDMDGLNGLEITDGVYVLSFMFLGGTAPPAPFPACGQDSKPGALSCLASICPH